MPTHNGVIVGANDNAAWLLPWWWRQYTRHNTHPVTFVDFGLSSDAVAWCRERGELLSLDPLIVTPKHQIDPILIEAWEHLYGKNVWTAREGWFNKPFALLKSPYKTTLWLDLDCEVCAPLQSLFDTLDPNAEMALVPDEGRPGIYNSGVILVRSDSPLLRDWAERCQTKNQEAIGDDYLLSALIDTNLYSIQTLSSLYNWTGGIHPDAIIHHWVANWGKLFIETHGGYQEYRDWLSDSIKQPDR